MVDMEQLGGSEVDGWQLTNCIGRGADGIVYSARKNGAEAAVKLFFPESLEANGFSAARDRLELQRMLIGNKHHPNLVEIYAGGEDAGLCTLFLVMELVAGTSLDRLIGQIPPSAIVLLAGQLASAARYLETLGLVHRDIKPANIVISDDFQTLTLLDLGIVHQLPVEDDQGRLSGMEFVATLRYSPPEFVWRKEQGDADGAWRAVTLYQIGATLHDMIMGQPLFTGHDVPRACLYDSVRDRTPIIESDQVDGWLIQTAQACLLKDWRQRLQFVSWESFFAPASIADFQQREKKIRLRQIRNEEMRQAAAKQILTAPGPSREQQLWHLNNTLMLEIRTYLLDSLIFPKCRIEEEAVSQREYVTHFRFERDLSRDFQSDVIFTVTLSVDGLLEEATKLTFKADVGGHTVSTAAWREMFAVETAFAACQQSFLDSVDSMLSI